MFLTNIKEIKSEYEYATKSEVSDLANIVLNLTKLIERIEEQILKKKGAPNKLMQVDKKIK
jgi:hypothetical protein